MRIPSPDPDLTGQVLAKEIPNDPNRTTSIYADQFLAHKCPPHFDEVQRRQFFCILDLRRLKYAADEIFAKKDWKLNILNFAKEYEKSRGLIMLRYGLYEFKSVKPTNEVLKKWRAAHGLGQEPEEDHNSSNQIRRTPGPTKRKADEELPKDNTLMASTANQNKRRNLAQEVDNPVLAGPAPFKKSKRKADETEELDENQPNKQQKSTPSSATSLFESILNKPRNSSASPLKQTPRASAFLGLSKPKESQDAKFATKANPFEPTNSGLTFGATKINNTSTPSGSVLSSHKIGSTPVTNTANIFSYLSESSNGSGNENDNADDRDTDSEPEQNSEEQSLSGAVSTSTSTPPVQNGSSPFTVGKPGSASDIFGGLSKPTGQSTKGGLFERVQMGANGQPVRASPGLDEKQDGLTTQSSTAKEQQTKTPAKTPGDYTFNPATTPISFGQPTLEVSKPASKSFGTTDLGHSAKSNAPEPKKTASIFDVGSQASSMPKLNAPSVFGVSGSAKPQSSETPVSIFALPKPTSASTNIFGAAPATSAAKRPFGASEQANEASQATKKQAVSIFDKPAASAPTTSETKLPSSNVDDKVASSISTPKSQVPSIFDKAFIAKNAAQAKTVSDSSKPSPDLFSRNSNPLFGAAKESKSDTIDDKTKAPEKEVETTEKKDEPSIASSKSQAPSIFAKSFIADNAAQAKTLSDTSKPSPDLFSRSANPFGAPKANGATPTGTKSVFGEREKDVSSNLGSKNGTLQTPSNDSIQNTGSTAGPKAIAPPLVTPSIFGTPASSKIAAPTSSIFGEKKKEEPPKPAASVFGSTPAASSSIFGFKAQTTGNTTSQSPSMTFGASTTAGPSIPFGASSSQTSGPAPKKLGFQFGSSTPDTSSTSAFTFGQSSSGSGFTFTAGGRQTSRKESVRYVAAHFGQQPSSTPKTAPSSQSGGIFGASTNANGAPTFSFTQASPSQNSSGIGFPKASAPVSPFGHLQASEGSTIVNSPFPAPSSIGTTPVNGTPEPQSPREDGEEAPQEQIKLTEGGPGEEDEAILHEVRAKAIKFIPVEKRDEDKQKSPWSTQGVGPLRVLKNKSTGAVRILLRAEPRGHIAMNKTILSDVEYKAKEKTVNFVAASDDGSGLETWLLQVKKPELAAELAGVLEANKGANKK
ncbi:hypothetical protein O1611_g9333 [Lasiodiplodia mahajangana]|uniref:Uncharacterized protein n=1 Tax=Lasiodiplodia mahajangana TaxID=1108764 RepID=A0ACC2J9X1_9PEZI|nr:hypothetical protein O1611_g9333 [Lasiodiplodia mahajangana]